MDFRGFQSVNLGTRSLFAENYKKGLQIKKVYILQILLTSVYR